MRVLTLASRKGGVGKSTLALHLAEGLARSGHRTALVDADPQATVAKWAYRRNSAGHEPHLDVYVATAVNLERELERLARDGHELAVLDTPPHVGRVVDVAIQRAHLVLVPLRPAYPDGDAVGLTLQLCAGTTTPVWCVLNQCPTHRYGPQRTEDFAELLRGAGHQVLSASVGARVAFADAQATGATVFGYRPRGRAAAELEALVSIVGSLLELA